MQDVVRESNAAGRISDRERSEQFFDDESTVCAACILEETFAVVVCKTCGKVQSSAHASDITSF